MIEPTVEFTGDFSQPGAPAVPWADVEAVLDHFAIPRQDDELVGLEGMKIRVEGPGLEGDGGPHLGGPGALDLIERQPP